MACKDRRDRLVRKARAENPERRGHKDRPVLVAKRDRRGRKDLRARAANKDCREKPALWVRSDFVVLPASRVCKDPVANAALKDCREKPAPRACKGHRARRARSGSRGFVAKQAPQERPGV